MIKYPESVTIEYFDENQNEKNLSVSGDSALIIQHEIDHLNGILIFDRLPNKEKDLFIPREKLYPTKHVLFSNYGLFISLKKKLGFKIKIQSITQYYSLLFDDSVNYKQYILDSVKRRTELIKTILKETSQNGLIIEAGCGTSALSVYLSKKKYDVTCIDSNEDMLDLAERFNKQLKTSVKYKNENIMDIKSKKTHLT